MIKLLFLGLVAGMVSGCASLLDHQAAVEPATDTVAADMRARLELLRRKPELASDELIQEFEAFLRTREQQRRSAVVVKPPQPVPSLATAEALFERARMLEGARRVSQAMPLYSNASRQGLAAATVRLMEIYSVGAEGVSRDYLAAVRYKDLAVQQGVQLEYPPRR